VSCPLIAGWYESGYDLEIYLFLIEVKDLLKIVDYSWTKKSLRKFACLSFLNLRSHPPNAGNEMRLTNSRGVCSDDSLKIIGGYWHVSISLVFIKGLVIGRIRFFGQGHSKMTQGTSNMSWLHFWYKSFYADVQIWGSLLE